MRLEREQKNKRYKNPAAGRTDGRSSRPFGTRACVLGSGSSLRSRERQKMLMMFLCKQLSPCTINPVLTIQTVFLLYLCIHARQLGFLKLPYSRSHMQERGKTEG